MKNDYNKTFYDSFCGKDYSDEAFWRAQFGRIADKIVEYFTPETVLDAGCANGYLVSELRKRGVKAYGIDISEHAIESAGDDIREFLNAQSLTEPLPKSFPQKFDLVVTIEVLEHMTPEDGKAAISRLCSYSDTLLFSSTPYDLENKTHINVQQVEYWAREFAENSYFRNMLCPTDFLTPWAMLFHKLSDVPSVIFNYELSNRVDELKRKQKQEHTGSIFYETEASRSPIPLHNFTYDGETAKTERISIPADARKIIFVLNEQSYSAIYGMTAATDRGLCTPCFSNAAYSDDMVAFFPVSNPTYHFDVSDPACAWIEFEASVSVTTRLKDLEMMCTLIEKIKTAQQQIIDAESSLTAAEAELDSLESLMSLTDEKHKEEASTLYEEIARLNKELNAMVADRNAWIVQADNYKMMYDTVNSALFWKITKPFRLFMDLIKKVLKKIPPVRLTVKFFRCLRQNGFQYTRRKVKDFLRNRQDYSAIKHPLYTPAELEAQKKHIFSRDVKFSILVPLYNTPERFLKEMIQSVLDQTYGNFELCLADGSDDKHAYVRSICMHYAASDKRVLYRKLEKNLGISGNTNACIEMSSGDYIGLFDHDDLLHPALLYNIMEAICEKNADFIYTDENTFSKSPKDAYCPHFKPDFSPDTLRSYNYICHFSCFSKALLDRVGHFRPECDGSQDYDMILRLTEQAESIVHIPKILYYWRAHAASVATDISAKPYVIKAAQRALSEHLARIGLKGTVTDAPIPSTYKINYDLIEQPLISIVIANKDHIDDLDKCICSIVEKSTYTNYEIVVVENNSTDAKTFEYYEKAKKQYGIRVVTWQSNGKFNYSAINNLGVKESKGDYVLLLNNDIEIITPEWLEEMLMFAQRKDVGAVGVKLYYPDNTIQHAGVILGIGGVGGHSHKYFPRSNEGYMSRTKIAQNLSAVTAACIMVPRRVWDEVGGLDETFEVAFNDVDFCMRIRKAGYLIVFTPFAELYHYESKSRGLDNDPVKRRRFQDETDRFQNRWGDELASGDPYYNPNLSLEREDFSLR